MFYLQSLFPLKILAILHLIFLGVQLIPLFNQFLPRYKHDCVCSKRFKYVLVKFNVSKTEQHLAR